jgi:hypothetical protein
MPVSHPKTNSGAYLGDPTGSAFQSLERLRIARINCLVLCPSALVKEVGDTVNANVHCIDHVSL